MTEVASKIDQARSFLTSLEAVADKREQYLAKYGYTGLSTKNVPVIVEPEAPTESTSEPPRVMSQLEIQAIHAKYASVNQTPGSRSFVHDLNKTPSYEQLKQTEDKVDLVLKYQTPKKRPPPEVEQEDDVGKTGILDKYKSRIVTAQPAAAFHFNAKEEVYKPIVSVLEKYRSAKVIEKELEELDNNVELAVGVNSAELTVTDPGPALSIPIPHETVFDSDMKTPYKERGVKFDLDKYRTQSANETGEVFTTPNPVFKPASVTKPAGKREVDAASILAQYSKRNRESIVQKDCSLSKTKAETSLSADSSELKSSPSKTATVEKENVEMNIEKNDTTSVCESSEKPSQMFAATKQDILAKYKNKYNAL